MDDIRRELISLRRQVRLLSAVALGAFATLLWVSGGGELAASARALVSGGVLFEGSGGATTQDGANFFWNDANNRLGLGTASPAARLDVNGSTRLRSTTSFGSSGQEAEVAWSSNVGNGEPGTFFRAKSGRSAVLGSNGNLAGVTVSSSGDVTVNEGGLVADFRVESDTDANALFINGLTGHVGLGTDIPAARLDLHGGLVLRPKPGAALTANFTHDYALPDAVYVRISSVADIPADLCRITGLTGGVDGRVIVFHNLGTEPFALNGEHRPESLLSQPQNRIIALPSLYGYHSVPPQQMLRIMYDGTVQRWRVSQ